MISRIISLLLFLLFCGFPCFASGYQQLLPVPIPVIDGGTGLATLTAHYVLVGEGTGNVGLVAAGTNGQLLIGQTGLDPAFMTVSGDATISAAGVISLKTSGVTAGTYQTASITVDSQGRVTSAGNGSPSSLALWIMNCNKSRPLTAASS